MTIIHLLLINVLSCNIVACNVWNSGNLIKGGPYEVEPFMKCLGLTYSVFHYRIFLCCNWTSTKKISQWISMVCFLLKWIFVATSKPFLKQECFMAHSLLHYHDCASTARVVLQQKSADLQRPQFLKCTMVWFSCASGISNEISYSFSDLNKFCEAMR